MARITLTLPLLLSVVWATVPDSITYVGPDTVVELSQGFGQYQVGIKDGDTLKGPCRLIAADTRLYLLDQFNNRVLCFDTAGSFVFEAKACFQPVDMAVDDSGLIHLLDNHSNPALVVTYDGVQEVDRMEVKYDSRYYLDGLVIYPEYGLLVQYGYGLLEPVPVFDIGGFLNCQPTIKKYRLRNDKYLRREGWIVDVSGTSWSTSYGSEIYRKGKGCLPFLENDTSVRIIVGVRIIMGRGDTTYVKRNIHVRLNDIPTMLLRPVSEDYFLYNKDWRNVSVDDAGNIYIFASVPQGGASILRWRPSPP